SGTLCLSALLWLELSQCCLQKRLSIFSTKRPASMSERSQKVNVKNIQANEPQSGRAGMPYLRLVTNREVII
ncbi:MAG: hypothetical protein AAGI49_20380, partial [Bacteroidota bacterium]